MTTPKGFVKLTGRDGMTRYWAVAGITMVESCGDHSIVVIGGEYRAVCEDRDTVLCRIAEAQAEEVGR